MAYAIVCLTETIIHWEFLINNRQQNFALSNVASLSVLFNSRRTNDEWDFHFRVLKIDENEL